MKHTPPPRAHDEGTVLPLTLVLVVVLGLIVVGLLDFVAVGLRTADVASTRSETNADSTNAMNWAVEQFAKKQLRPDDSCGEAPTYLDITLPEALDLALNGSTTRLQCAQTNPITGEPVVHLIATSTGDQTRTVEATVEIPRYSHGARVSDWRVDIPVVVPDYVTTTTGPSGSPTTTTTTTIANVAPVALDTTWELNPNTTSTQSVLATDTDGTIVLTDVMGLEPGWAVTPSGASVEITVNEIEGTFSLSYNVTDDDGATSSASLTIVVTTGPIAETTTTTVAATTTTTLAPAPACTFTVTNAHQNGKTGSGTLTVTNTGGDFTGWQVKITQPSATNPWMFTWGDPSLTVNSAAQHQTVSSGNTVTQQAPYTVTAALQNGGGHPKITSGANLPCVVLAP